MGAYYNEIDPYAAQWLRNLIDSGEIAPGDVDERSIEDVTPDELAGYTQCHFFAGIGVWSHALRRAGWGDDRPVWTGSCPCQGFSTAGQGAGFTDERHLWPSWFHLIQHGKPADTPVFGEQVASKLGRIWFDLVQADMEGLGHSCWGFDICSAGFGAPHIRQRLYFAAKRMADAERDDGRPDQSQRQAQGRVADGRGSTDDGMADSSGERCDGERVRLLTRQERQAGPEATGGSEGSGMADAHTVGQPRQGQVGRPGDTEAGPDRQVGGAFDAGNGSGLADAGRHGHDRTGPVNGFWGDADWLLCRDGKWRPVEPGTQPLVDGSAFKLGSGSAFEGKNRVGMLKGYGNALTAPTAIEFIKTFMHICDLDLEASG